MTSPAIWRAWTALDSFTLLAQAAGGAAPGAAQRPNDFGPMIALTVGLVALLWIIVLNPQKKEQRKRQEQLDALGKGDQVVTAGGLHGTVEGIDVNKGTVSLTIAPKTTVTVSKTYLASVLKKKGGGDKDEKQAGGNGKG